MAANRFSLLCSELDAKKDWRAIEPEDMDEILEVATSLESVLADEESFPQPPDDSQAGELARLLWYKSHPDSVDVDFVLDQLRDNLPIARLTAADTITELLASGAPLEPNEVIKLARGVFLQQRTEASEMIAYRLEEAGALVKRAPKAAPEQAAKAKARAKENPYLAGLPIRDPDLFFGRKDLLAKIDSTLGSRPGINSVILYGARRTGKTSLLLQIRAGALDERFVPVYLDLQAHGGSSLEKFLSYLISRISTSLFEDLEIKAESLPQSAGEPDFEFLQKFLRAVKEQIGSKSLLLLFDEYEVLGRFVRDADVARQFQSLFEQVQGFYCIFAGSKKVEDLKEKGFVFLIDASAYEKITFLSEAETRELITGPAKGTLEYEPEVVDEMWRLTAGHPYYTQLLCQSVLDHAQRDGKATRRHLDRAVGDFLSNPTPHLILSWRALPIEQELVGASLAELEEENDGAAVTPKSIVKHLRQAKLPMRMRLNEVRLALAALREGEGWIAKEQGRQRYRFSMELVRLWVAEYRSIFDVIAAAKKTVFSQVAGFWRQLGAWGIDLGFSCAVALLVVTVGGLLFGMDALHWMLAALLGAYFIGPLLGGAATPGHRLVKLVVRSNRGVAPSRGQRLGLGLLLVVRAILWIEVVVLSWFHSEQLLLAMVAVLAFIEAADALLTYFGRTRRGLLHKFAGTLLVRTG